MASDKIVVLSSSQSSSTITITPPRGKPALHFSSSPVFPSPSQLMLKRSTGRVSASQRIAVPGGTNVGFTTASNLLRESYEVRNDSAVSHNETTSLPPPATKSVWDDISIAQEPELPSNHATEGVPKTSNLPRRKPRPVNPTINASEKAVKGLKPESPSSIKRSRTKKTQDEVQTKIKKGKVTKPTAPRLSARSIHFDGKPGPREESTASGKETCLVNAAIQTEESNLGLDRALPRRKDWTPVKDSSRLQCDTNTLVDSSDTSHTQKVLSDDLTTANETETLLCTYRFAEEDKTNSCRASHAHLPDGESATKRRKLEVRLEHRINDMNGLFMRLTFRTAC